MKKSDITKIKNDKKIKYCFIKKHGAFYRNNSCGYTELTTKAGVYWKDDAIKHAMSCSDIFIIPIDIEIYNQLLISEISDLLNRIIKTK